MVTSYGPIARDPAQREARRELSRAVYHQTSVPQDILHAIESFLQRIFASTSHAAPGGWWTLVALAVVIVLIVAAVLTRTGPLTRSARRAAPLYGPGGAMTARQCRSAAEDAAAGGDYSEAILQRLRAVALGCEERRVLVPDAGRTADELAALAGARFPGHAGDLADAARLFDRIRFGDGTGTREGYQRLKDLDDTLARLTPAAPHGSPAPSVTVPA